MRSIGGRARRLPAWGALLLLGWLLASCAGESEPGAVHIVVTTGTVNSVMERYLDRAIGQAEDSDARAVVLRVDTPGGELGAMKGIAGRIERATVPVIAWVGPPGAQAASAGTFIVMAGHIAAMAPGTTIGAATPITLTGDDVEGALGRKVTNDTVAFARGIATSRGRNADWAEQAVRQAISASPDEALNENVIDLLAPSINRLIEAVQGMEVELLDGARVTLDVVEAPRIVRDPNLYERVLNIVSDPMVVSILFAVGMLGLLAEFFSPGLFLPGTLGAVALLLAFLGVGTLLPAEAAIALLLLGVVLVIAEFFVPSGGILGSVAALAIVLGLSILLGQASTALSLAGFLRLLAVAVVSLVLLGVVLIVALVRAGYIAQSQQTGGRLL